jgi:ATP/maltotriose-dependent transcriptional regulator MalT
VDWCALLLCEIHLRTGRTGEAAERLVALAEPHHDVATRFAATRAQATVATVAGHHERAHHLLNTAAGLAARVPSRFRAALVERDRAVVLAREGRLNEARSLAERVLGPLVRPVAGTYQLWSRFEGASLALMLSRHSALAQDEGAARRLLQVGAEAAEPLGSRLLAGHLLLTTAVVDGADADPVEVEDTLSRAAAGFERSGDRTAAALVLLEHGRLAHRRGLERSARPLYEQAGAELRACGHGADARLADVLLAALDAGRPPSP